MKFGWINGTPEQLWRWFTCKTANGEECSLELKLINAEDYAKAPKEIREDVLKYRAFVATNWCRDFKGATDANGAEVPNTLEMRIEILKHFDVWSFVTSKLFQSLDLESEGKGDSGSAS